MFSKLLLFFFVFANCFTFSTALDGQLAVQDECYFCASPIMETYWGATGFTQKPSNIPFSYDCYSNAGGVPPKNATGGTSYCTKLDRGCVELFMQINGENAVVRGCLSDFYNQGSDDIELSTINCTYTTIAQSGKGSSYAAVHFCRAIEGDNTPCNVMFNKDTDPTKNPNLGGRCTASSDRKCTSCSRFGDQGSCKHNSGGECTGPWCTKTTGKYGDTDFEIRGCSLNPLNANATKSNLPGVLAVPGSTMDETVQYTTYFCKNADHCNFSPQKFSIIFLPFVVLAYLI